MNSKAIMTAVRSARGWDVARWAPIPLRLVVGYGFLVHGYAKLVKGPDAFAGILHAIGVPAPHLMAWLTILIEVLVEGLRFLRYRAVSPRRGGVL